MDVGVGLAMSGCAGGADATLDEGVGSRARMVYKWAIQLTSPWVHHPLVL